MIYQYTNHSKYIQIVKIACLDRLIERVVFPNQTLNFEAKCKGYLEVYTYEYITMMLAEKIDYNHLCN